MVDTPVLCRASPTLSHGTWAALCVLKQKDQPRVQPAFVWGISTSSTCQLTSAEGRQKGVNLLADTWEEQPSSVYLPPKIHTPKDELAERALSHKMYFFFILSLCLPGCCPAPCGPRRVCPCCPPSLPLPWRGFPTHCPGGKGLRRASGSAFTCSGPSWQQKGRGSSGRSGPGWPARRGNHPSALAWCPGLWPWSS